MARGWESKSVEEQMEAARERRRPAGSPLTPEQADTERKRDSLLLQRTRVLRELANCAESRRKTLAAGLAYLESQLAMLGWRPE